jgi:hypothetical protein
MRRLNHAAASALAVAGLLSLQGTASAQFFETEPNGTKADAAMQGVVTVSPGGFVSGTTTGTLVAAGSGVLASADTYLIQTTPMPLGIYQHRLTITTTGTAGHTGTIRGLNQVSGVIGITDNVMQTSSVSTTPARFNQWYGFGRQENVFYRVTGGISTTSPYQATLSTTPVAPSIIGPLSSGTVVLAGVSGDTEVLVYDAAFNPVPGFMNDDFGGGSTPFNLSRIFTAGTYYIAVGRANTTNDQPSPPDDSFRNGTVTDFANVMVASQVTSSAVMTFNATDCNGPVTVTAALTEPFQVLWFQATFACPDVVITANPVSADICLGQEAVLQVVASGTPSYQWRKDGIDIPGANSDTFTIPAIAPADEGAYDVVVSNCCGNAATSSVATIGVREDGPDITDHPDPQSLCIGSTATFTVAAEPTLGNDLIYLWRKDGIDIAGATSATLSFNVASLADGGQYDCVVTEECGCGSTTTAPALLTVRNSPPLITPIGPGEINLGCQSTGYVELGAVAVDDCDTSVAVTIGGDVVGSHGPGVYIVRYNAVDSQGNHALEVTRTVTIQDNTRPKVIIAATNPLLLHNNHHLVNVGLLACVTDACDQSVSQASLTIRVFSDEVELPTSNDGSGFFSPDAKNIAPGTLRLRSERRGSGNGRVYLIVASATDGSGNTGFGLAVAVCPHSASHFSMLSVAAEALAAAAVVSCNLNDAQDIDGLVAPLTSNGWTEHGLAAPVGAHQ